MSDMIDRLNAALEGRYQIDRELGEGGMAGPSDLADDINYEGDLSCLRERLSSTEVDCRGNKRR